VPRPSRAPWSVAAQAPAGAGRPLQKKAYPYSFESNRRGEGMSMQNLEQDNRTVTAFCGLMFNQCPGSLVAAHPRTQRSGWRAAGPSTAKTLPCFARPVRARAPVPRQPVRATPRPVALQTKAPRLRAGLASSHKLIA